MKKCKILVKNPVLGVPITIIDSFDPNQFSIVAFRKGTDGKDLVYTVERERVGCYWRVLIVKSQKA
jgi:hypothetical protein